MPWHMPRGDLPAITKLATSASYADDAPHLEIEIIAPAVRKGALACLIPSNKPALSLRFWICGSAWRGYATAPDCRAISLPSVQAIRAGMPRQQKSNRSLSATSRRPSSLVTRSDNPRLRQAHNPFLETWSTRHIVATRQRF